MHPFPTSCIPSSDSPRAIASKRSAKILNASKKYENHHDDQGEANASRREISPLPAVRPAGQSTYQRQNQEHYQDRSKHFSLLCKLQPSRFSRHPPRLGVSAPSSRRN